MCNVKQKDRISAVKLTNRLLMNTIRESLQNRRLGWFGHQERMEGNTEASKY